MPLLKTTFDYKILFLCWYGRQVVSFSNQSTLIMVITSDQVLNNQILLKRNQVIVHDFGIRTGKMFTSQAC